MREAILRVGIRFCPEDERDPGVIGAWTKVNACSNLQVVGDRSRAKTIAATSRVPINIALEETGMLSRAKDAFKIAVREEDGRSTEDHVTDC